MYTFLVHGMLREHENSHYQFQRGLFNTEDFEARTARFQTNFTRFQGWRDVWAANRDYFAPSFRAEIDRIVSEVGG